MIHKRPFFILLMFCGYVGNAQYFTTDNDTVYSTVTTQASVYNLITNISSSDIQVGWNVSDHDFPPDWSGAGNLAICDNALCRTNGANLLLSGTVFNSAPYTPGVPGDFHLMLDLAGASPGTHYIAVNIVHGTQSKDVTFIVNHWPLSTRMENNEGLPVIYPNPASCYLSICGLQDISRIVCINSFGQSMLNQKVSERDLAIPILDWPPGVYSVLYFDTRGYFAGGGRFSH